MNRVDGNFYVAGRLTANQFDTPAGTIGDEQMNSGSPIDTDKQRHLHTKVFAQIDGGSAFDEIRAVHVALTEGTVSQFQAGCRVQAIGDSTLTVDLYKNGVSILSDVIDLDSSVEEYDQVVAGINPTFETYAPGDVFEVVVVTTDGTGTPPEGLFAQVTFSEGAF